MPLPLAPLFSCDGNNHHMGRPPFSVSEGLASHSSLVIPSSQTDGASGTVAPRPVPKIFCAFHNNVLSSILHLPDSLTPPPSLAAYLLGCLTGASNNTVLGLSRKRPSLAPSEMDGGASHFVLLSPFMDTYVASPPRPLH